MGSTRPRGDVKSPRGDAEPRDDALPSAATPPAIPQGLPAWILRRPPLLVAALLVTNLFGKKKLAWVGVAVAASLYAWAVTWAGASAAVVFGAEHFVLVFVLGAIHAFTSVMRRQQRVSVEAENSWLAPLPYRLPTTVRLGVPLVVQLLVLGALLVGVSAAGPASFREAGTVWAAVGGGFLVGAGIAALARSRFRGTQVASSQRAFVHRVREGWARAPKLQPLSYWAIARARALNNPGVSARTMIVILLGIPLGTTGAVAVATAAGWMVGVYLVLNLVAIVRTAFPAAWWLTPTPITFARFVSTVPARTLLAQAIACAALLAAVAAISRPVWIRVAFIGTGTWLALVTAVALLSCVVAFHPDRWPAAALHRRLR
jgi:hypothetical protein